MEKTVYNKIQIASLVILRTIVGWHFLYEGVFKMIEGNWTSKSFLESSDWIFSGFFRFMADQPFLLQVTDYTTLILLTGSGLLLMLGLFSRPACLMGMFLLAMFWLAHPPLGNVPTNVIAEGNYLIVNKNLVELCALFVLFNFPVKKIGLDALIRKPRKM